MAKYVTKVNGVIHGLVQGEGASITINDKKIEAAPRRVFKGVRCWSCGQELHPSDTHCPGCGQKLERR